VTLLDLFTREGGEGTKPFKVALVDSPEAGTTLLAILFDEGGHTAVFDFDALIEREDIEPLGPVVTARVETELRAQLDLE